MSNPICTPRMATATVALLAAVLFPGGFAQDVDPVALLAGPFAREVKMRLELPEPEQQAYAQILQQALRQAGIHELGPQYVLMVDRSSAVQAVFIYWLASERVARFVGAAPASTGRPGTYDHFYTPLGVFAHTPANMDFRAEGTRNDQGIRGYGVKGMRVYDFGWVEAERGWGPHGTSLMRLQVHATDPDLLEKFLGNERSKGCIRIPATLNTFIDRYGLLDADYEAEVKEGRQLWVLRPDREQTPWPGRYLVVVDSGRTARPNWVTVILSSASPSISPESSDKC